MPLQLGHDANKDADRSHAFLLSMYIQAYLAKLPLAFANANGHACKGKKEVIMILSTVNSSTT